MSTPQACPSIAPDFTPIVDPALAAEGWVRRFTTDPPRAQEALALYRELGFEVRAVQIRAEEFSRACGDCRLEVCRAYVTLYTRRKRAATEEWEG